MSRVVKCTSLKPSNRPDRRKKSRRALSWQAEACEDRTLLSSVTGAVFEDLGNDGIQQPSERRLNGFPVTLWRAGADKSVGTADDVFVSKALTDSAGLYQFAVTTVDQYRVRFGGNVGAWKFSVPNVSSGQTTSDVDAGGFSAAFSAGQGASDVAIDAGISHNGIAASRARWLKSAHNFQRSAPNYSLNYFGNGEKWLKGDWHGKGQWYFVTPAGDLYAWNPAIRDAVGEYIASVGVEVYANPLLLHSTLGEVGVTGTSSRQLAWDLDSQLSLRAYSTWNEAYGGLGVRWVSGDKNQYGTTWYFIRPDGAFHAWDGRKDQATGAKLAQLSPAEFQDPILVTNAVRPAAGDTAQLIREAFGIRRTISRPSKVTSGTGVWFEGSLNQFGNTIYFLNRDGHLFAWNGSTTESGRRVAALPALTYSFPSVLSNAEYHVDQSSVSAAAWDLNRQYALRSPGWYSQNWAGMNEKWLDGTTVASGKKTYFIILPSGEVRRVNSWKSSPRSVDSTYLTTLSPVYYQFPELLHNAVREVAFATDGGTGSADKVSPVISLDGTSTTMLSNGNVTITGQVTDNTTGVDTLLAQLDLGDAVNVAFAADGRFTFTTSASVSGSSDGAHVIRFRATDKAGNVSALTTLNWTLDTIAPIATGNLTGTLQTAPQQLLINFSEAMPSSALVPGNYSLRVLGGTRNGEQIPIQSVNSTSSNRVVLLLNSPLENLSYQLTLSSAVKDAAGNRATPSSFSFTVAQPTRLSEISPASGEEMVSVTRETVIRFDRQVDPATITPQTFFITAASEPVTGRIRVSPTERFATFFYDNPLPASTRVVVSVDGDKIMGRDGMPLDADNDSEPGGAGVFEFTTLPLTLIANTSVWGYVYDSYNTIPQELAPIAVPTGDPLFDPAGTGNAKIPFVRAEFYAGTGTNTDDPRLRPNRVTSFIDASMVYGSDTLRARALRAIDGSGRLKMTSDGMLPLNNLTSFPNGVLANENKGQFPNDQLPVAGDVRAAEFPGLTALHTLLAREHNRKADEIKAAHANWSDELIYQTARKWVSAIIQNITYQEYLPTLLGPGSLAAYSSYNPNIDPSITTLFSTAAFRIGHSQQSAEILRLNNTGASLPGGPLSLRNAFFNPNPIADDGIEAYLRGLIAQTAEEVDTKVVDDLRNFLFGPPGAGGMDLAAISIQRGRDMGLPSYLEARTQFGLSAVTSFSQITSNAALAIALQQVYQTVDKVDLWVGGLAEAHIAGGSVGPLFAAIIKDQFLRSRNGDRFWFENGQFSTTDLAGIRGTTMARLIARNTAIAGLSGNVFTSGTSPSGPAAGGSVGTSAEFPTYDGSKNNPTDPRLGQTNQPLLNGATVGYGDGRSTTGGAGRPDARLISNQIANQTSSNPSVDGLTSLSVVWGQLISHDLSLTPTQSAKGTDIPIVNATISLDALPDIKATTDKFGFFELTSPNGLPAPEFFVHIDGSTAINAPAGTSYATLGKPFHSIAGQSVQLKMDGTPFNVFLPPMAMRDVVTLNTTSDTVVGFGPAAQDEIRKLMIERYPNNPAKAAEQAQLIIDTMRVTYPAGSAMNEAGTPATRAMIVPVDPSRLPAPLPPGVDPALVISIQAGSDAGFNLAGGTTNFDVPAPVVFPNLEGFSPGESTSILSFDHDAGKWRVVGSATIDPSGRFATSNPNNGILAPGWHILTDPPDKPDPPCPTCCPPPALSGNARSAKASDKGGLCEFCNDAQARVEACITHYNSNTDKAKATYAEAMYICAINITKPSKFPKPPEFFACGLIAVRNLCRDLLNAANDLTRCVKLVNSACDSNYNVPSNVSSFCESVAGKRSLTYRNESSTNDRVEAMIVQLATLFRSADAGDVAIDDDFVEGAIDIIDGIDDAVGGDAVTYYRQLALNLELQIPTFPEGRILPFEIAPSTPVFYRADLRSSAGSMRSIYGKTEAFGQYQVFSGRNEEIVRVEFYDPLTNSTGGVVPFLRTDAEYRLPPFVLTPLSESSLDTDGDGFFDEAELILGTHWDNADSDGDGISDFEEFNSGTNPLSGIPVASGPIASLPLRGEAREVAISATPTSRTGYVATGFDGLAIVDLSQLDRPAILGQLDLNGDAQDVAVDSLVSVAVVAAGAEGLHFVDVANPSSPRRLRTVAVAATQVELIDGIVYAAAGNRIQGYDPLSGDLMATLVLPASGDITGLTHDGDILYAMDANSKLHVLRVSPTSIEKLSDLVLPQGAGQISVSNGVLYAAAITSYDRGGFATVDVSDPAIPLLISGSDVVSPFVGPGTAVLANGSGLGLVVGSPNGQHMIQVMNLQDPENTDSFLTRFNLTAAPQNLAIASGIGYIANGSGGLVVVNYVPFDNMGLAPTVTATGPSGSTVQEGSIVPIRVAVTDDVQVRDVELLINGVVVANDVSAPFDLSAITPALNSGVTDVRFQVRATDTGGNIGLSDVLTYSLTQDITPPQLSGSNPANGSAGFRVNAITLRFDTPIDVAQLASSGFTLMNLGANFVLGGGGDSPVTIDRFEALSSRRIVIYPSQPLTEGNYQFTAQAGFISDIAGNVPVSDIVLNFTSFDLDEQNSVAWISDSNGDWNEPSNWSTGQVPGPNDAVIIDRKTANVSVRLPSGNMSVRSLISREDFLMNGGSLTVNQPSEIEGRFEIGNGSTLTVNGAEALFKANGDTKIDGANFEARNGGRISLPQATSYTHTSGNVRDDVFFRATGSRSVIDLPNLASVTNGVGNGRITLEALSGGVLNLSNVRNFSDTAANIFYPTPDSIYIRASGAGSLVNLSQLTTFVNPSPYLAEISAKSSGEVRLPLLTQADGVMLVLDGTGTVLVSQITDFTDGKIELSGRAYSFPSLQVASGTNFLLRNGGTSADFAMLQTIQNGGFEVLGGAAITANLLSNIDGANLLVTGGVSVELPNVTSYTHTSAAIRDEAILRASGPGSVINLSNVTGINNGPGVGRITLEALAGGIVNLSKVLAITDTAANVWFPTPDSIAIRASGAGSLVNLSQLSTFVNPSPYLAEISAKSSGEVRIPLLTQADGVMLVLDGTGTVPVSQISQFTDGRIESTGGAPSFNALVNANGTTILISASAGSISAPLLRSVRNGRLELAAAGALTAPLLDDINGADLLVSGGSKIILPLVLSYTHTAGGVRDDVTFRATGPGSVIDLSNAAVINNGTYT